MIALPRELTYEQNVELIRNYCDQEFVSKGMICDLYFHDSGDGNPHVHLLLTLRAMDEQGHWLPKAKTVYVLELILDRFQFVVDLAATSAMREKLRG